MFVAQAPEHLPSMAEMLSMTGLEFMRAVLEGKLSAPPIGPTMGYRLSVVEEGTVVFEGAPEFCHTNPMGTVHGGWYGTLLDSAMACAVMTRLPKGKLYTTLEYKINILRGLPVGREIQCTGVVNHMGRSTGVAHGELRGREDGKLYATGSTTCMVLSPE